MMLPDYEFREQPIHVFRSEPFVNEFPVKIHKQVEFCYVNKGTLIAEIEGQRRVLNQGDVYLIFPNIPHAVFKSEASVTIAIIDTEILHSYHNFLTHQKPTDAVIKKEDMSPYVASMFAQSYQFYWSKSPFRSSVLHSLFNALLGTLLTSCKTVPRDSESELIEKILVYFSDHYTERITLDDISREFSYSKYYISHIINNTLHCNFSTLINSYRISLAQNLLLSSSKSIGDIATECGFSNQSSFNRVFVKQVGVSPCKFRTKRERYTQIAEEKNDGGTL